jgi:hypothetical protein
VRCRRTDQTVHFFAIVFHVSTLAHITQCSNRFDDSRASSDMTRELRISVLYDEIQSAKIHSAQQPQRSGDRRTMSDSDFIEF